MQCPTCHRTVREAQFCTHCGGPLDEDCAEVIGHGSYDFAVDDFAPGLVMNTEPDALGEDLPAPHLKHTGPNAIVADEACEEVEAAGAHDIDVSFEDDDEDAEDEANEVVAAGDEDDDELVEHDDATSGASLELKAILSNLRAEPREPARLQVASTSDVVTDPGLLMSGPGIDDDGFVLGDTSGPVDERGFVFGDEEDSGPVPLVPEDYRAVVTQPPIDRRPRRVRLSHALARVEDVRRMAAHGVARARQIPRQHIVVGLIVLIAVCGIGYALTSAGTGEAPEQEPAANELIAEQPSTREAPQGAATAPSYELVRLTSDAGEVPEPGASGETKPSTSTPSKPSAKSKKAGVAFSAQNVFSGNTAATSFKLVRPCVLREGPASRFRQVKPLNTGDTLSVITTSEPDWRFSAQGALRGWGKGCEGSSCALRMGPGEGFRLVEPGDDVPAPTGGVVSSAKWRYVQAGDKFGWTGPVCFK